MKISELGARMFNRVFVCLKCKSTIKADSMKIRAKKIVCKKCQSRNFRVKKKEKKVIK